MFRAFWMDTGDSSHASHASKGAGIGMTSLPKCDQRGGDYNQPVRIYTLRGKCEEQGTSLYTASHSPCSHCLATFSSPAWALVTGGILIARQTLSNASSTSSALFYHHRDRALIVLALDSGLIQPAWPLPRPGLLLSYPLPRFQIKLLNTTCFDPWLDFGLCYWSSPALTYA